MSTDCKTSSSISTEIDTLIFNSIDHVNERDWDLVQSGGNVYLSLPYLKALESGLPAFDFRYFIFYNNLKQPVGLGYCQIVKVTQKEINTDALVKRMGGLLPKKLLNSLDLRVLICGNAFASGENGFMFTDKISLEQGFNLLANAIEEINHTEKKLNRKVAITLIKEFWPQTFKVSDHLKEYGCSEVNIDVNMILTLDDSWKTFDDYLQAMNSKFRTKAKHVLKKSADLEIVDFTPEVIKNRLDEIDELYNFIVDKANFSFGRLNAQTLYNIKLALGKDFLFKGYYLKGKLIGFSTATAFENVLDGNFIGLDYEFNQSHAVYQRILYDFIQHAFDIGAKVIKIGRTAEEIKSGVGATPTEMKFYAKHRNKVTNAILRPLVQNLKPSDFELRKPFKVEYYK
ncbi:MAG: hypothetical protein HKP14_01070 [Bacteroidia bacterium]|nr:hypothetical protein [Bacteroidia bacterium]